MVRICFPGCDDFNRADEARLVGNLAEHKQAFGDECAEMSMAISRAPIAGVGVSFGREGSFMTSRVARPLHRYRRERFEGRASCEAGSKGSEEGFQRCPHP
jgi:hypothetical protein